MGPVLVHAQGGGQGAAAGHGDPRQLEEALDGAVLPVGPVENGQGAVQGNHPVLVGEEGQQPVNRRVRGDRHRGEVVQRLGPSVGGDVFVGPGIEVPAAGLGDAQGEDVVLLPV